MEYTRTEVEGVTIVDIEPHRDSRGFFSRSFDTGEFEANGLAATVVQTNISFNHATGTLRGLHRQCPPYTEAKLVRCTRGAVVDVAVDVRPHSTTYLEHVKVELTADNHRALFLPPYVAHGFQTLTTDTEVIYQVSGPYAPAGEQGFRYDDPAFGVMWPLPVSVISDKDASWPLIIHTGTPEP
ncbi:dTDP-4-dehydrorhamnose 3,5-epimerase [Rhodococcus sp. PvR044]|uniref:dTDP-4-dehydrorhamnose 3,5-epimerase family protein n=1 Tax=Rhodococcus sp. PvR044 TaxID=3156402 RepID=UPI003396A85D